MKWFRSHILREGIVLSLLALLLVLADIWCYSITLPVELDTDNGVTTLHVSNTKLVLGNVGTPVALQFVPHDPVIHEYQIDGTDSTNNLTLDTAYLHLIDSSPYYRFQSWMRDLDGTSHWRDLRIWADTIQWQQLDWPSSGTRVSLPAASSLHIQVQLQRPETPMTLNLFMTNGSIVHITLNRNDRRISVTQDIAGRGENNSIATTYFPTDTAPFAAMVVDTLLRTILWAILVLLVVLTGESVVGLFMMRRVSTRRVGMRGGMGERPQGSSPNPSQGETSGRPQGSPPIPSTAPAPTIWRKRVLGHMLISHIQGAWRRLTQALHPLALVALLASLFFVSWVAIVQYHGEPHIFDASAYLFAAKMYAQGHLAVPIPPAIDRFPGPFMVQENGQWFGQYAPGTALTLVPGIWLGVPWLVEPMLGTFALLGVGLIAARLYNRQIATLAVILGTLSPFYTYLAASYLSHTVALFYLVWGLWALLRFTQGKALWNMPLSAAFFGMAGLTRDLVAVLFVAIMLPGVIFLFWQQVRKQWRRWLMGGALFLAVALFFVDMSLDFNMALTGDIWTTPRSLFFAGDHWGFGPNVGFYGQHTLAAGFVNLDELLTILAIDLFGWPFYLSFAFLVMPFLTRRAVRADWLLLLGTVIMIGAYIGYFYHGIYLGPRYLFETLPFLLILTARGIVTLMDAGVGVRHSLKKSRQGVASTTSAAEIQSTMPRISISIVTVALVALLFACNIFYYMPRQVELHNDYTSLPAGYQIDLEKIYHPPLHHAIVVTSDYLVYQMVLFPLNDPELHDDIIYALAGNFAEYTELYRAYPGRTLYRLDVGADGSVTYTPITSIAPS